MAASLAFIGRNSTYPYVQQMVAGIGFLPISPSPGSKKTEVIVRTIGCHVDQTIS